MKRLAVLTLAASLLAGCAIGPDYQRPDMPLPTAWHDNGEDVSLTPGPRWWVNFGDPVLTTMIDEALVSNGDLALAMARVDESRAQLTVATSYLLPTISGEASSVRSRPSPRGATPRVPGQAVSDLHRASGIASFELDLWGKYRRAHEAAKAGLLATESSYATVRLAVAAQVAEAYFALLTADQQLDISRRTYTTREESVRIRESRFQSGLTPELDYRQAQAEAAAAMTAVRKLEQSVAFAETALSVILGRSPREIVQEAPARGLSIDKLEVASQVPAGLPASLLSRRPDIAQAAAQLHYATASIGVAKADLLPSISLTGLLGYESLDLAKLVSSSSGTWSYGATASMPLLDFGRTLARVDMADAQQRSALAAYEQVVRNAFRETQDALVANRKTAQIVESFAQEVAAQERSLMLAKLRYDNGYSSYLEVLDSERGLFQAQLGLVEARRSQLSAVVSVCKALGGGWDPDKGFPEGEPENAPASDEAEAVSPAAAPKG